jgi:predicted small lipoprotein YifL
MLMTLIAIAGIGLAGPTNPPDATAAPAPQPITGVRVEAHAGQRFIVVIDGQPHRIVGGQTDLTLTGLPAGEHPVEIRSEDRLVVWGHGKLHLVDGDEVVLTVEEGRPVTVQGRTGVWQNITNERPQPRKKAVVTEKSED